MSQNEDKGVAEYSVEITEFKEWSINKYYDYSDLTADFNDLDDLNRQIAAARKALFRLIDTINKAERKAREAKKEYERTYNRKYLASSEKTDSAKKISAEIQVEDLENSYMYYEQLAKELNRGYHGVREELNALEAVGNNLRQQIKTV